MQTEPEGKLQSGQEENAPSSRARAERSACHSFLINMQKGCSAEMLPEMLISLLKRYDDVLFFSLFFLIIFLLSQCKGFKELASQKIMHSVFLWLITFLHPYS